MFLYHYGDYHRKTALVKTVFMPPMEPKRNTRAMRKSPVLEPKSQNFVEKCLLNQGTT